MTVHFLQFVPGKLWQKIRQQRPLNRSQRAHGLQASHPPAVAPRLQPAGAGDALVRNQNVSKLAAETLAALHHFAADDDAAAQPSADHGSDRDLLAVGAEDRKMSPQSPGVAIVQIGDRLAQPFRKTLADIKTRPISVHEISRSPRAQLARRTGRSRGIESNRHNLRRRNTGQPGRDAQPVFNLLEAHLRPLPGQRRMLAQTLDQELFIPIHQCVIDGSSTKINSGHDFHGCTSNEIQNKPNKGSKGFLRVLGGSSRRSRRFKVFFASFAIFAVKSF